jgi:hypothetical protein
MIALLAVACAALDASGSQLSRSALLRHAASTAAAAAATAAAPSLAIPPPDMLAKAPEATAQLREQAAPQVQYTPPSVKGRSTPEQQALAEHLQRTGARFYGAYWCSFCDRQRQMFGAGGARALPYVECAADGYQSAKATCRSKRDVTGYPTWEINGKFYGGMRTLRDLQALSGFDSAVTFPEYVPPPPPPRPPPPPGGFKAPAVQSTSGAEELALAQHLTSRGAKFYGARRTHLQAACACSTEHAACTDARCVHWRAPCRSVLVPLLQRPAPAVWCRGRQRAAVRRVRVRRLPERDGHVPFEE